METIKQLFGQSHVECRDMIQDLKLRLTKDEISVSQEQALKLIKKPKHVPNLDKSEYQVDQEI